MIYFVTNKADEYRKSIPRSLFPDITIIDGNKGLEMYFQIFAKKKIQAFDIEATGLDPYLLTPLLYGFGSKSTQFMFDWTVDISSIFEHIIKYNIIILGHNVKYDIKVVLVHYKIQLVKVYDTMLADQRLWMKSGYTWGLDSLVERYEKKHMFKATRNEFIGADINRFRITASHLTYLQGDLIHLFSIREKQRRLIHKYKMELLIYGIEFPLITIIAQAEVEGFVFDIERWKSVIKEDKDERFKTELELDQLVRNLREEKAKVWYESDDETKKIWLDPRLTLGGLKYNKLRVHNPDYDIFNGDGTTTNVNLFGDFMSHKDVTRVKKKVVFNPVNTNYSSPTAIVKIFAGLGEPLPNKIGAYSFPKLNSKGKLLVSANDFPLNETALEKYLMDKPESIMKDFIELKLKHSKLETAINGFGDNFLKKINPISGKIHTAFRQCFAVTGRMQSGGGKKEPEKYNAQNIPATSWDKTQKEADVRRRNCFTVKPDESVATLDYVGAELYVMASHAQDFRLIELSKGDMHSHLATISWRNIFKYRANQIAKLANSSATSISSTLREEYRRLKDLALNYTITKKDKKERTEFKPMGFGTIYGMYDKKAGETLKIPKEEGGIVIRTIENELPRTFNMVKRASRDAREKGFVILNDRTNSRAWFPLLIKQLKGEISMKTHFKELAKEESDARNIRIQGTQADFVKESTVVIWKYFVNHEIDASFLSWVHDEVVVRVPRILDGRSEEWIAYNTATPIVLPSPFIKGKVFDSLPQVIKHIMEVVANKYLVGLDITADVTVEDYWTK
jgi:DNA polymerase I-like protein with 3'-5' exonuclease and polymerase domains